MLRIAIVEDEEIIALTIKNYLKDFFMSIHVEFSCTHFDNAIKFLDRYAFDFDLIFMDINLPTLDGMSAVRELRKKDSEVKVIFVTSLAQYVIKGYEVNAFDFMLKPVNYYSFAIKLKRFMETYEQKENYIFVRVKNELVKINVSDIKYFEVINHKLIIHTTTQNYEIYDNLNKYLNMLSKDSFALCNRCYLVNLKYVNKVNKEFVLVGNDSLLVSRRKYNDFIDALNKYLANGGEINV